MENLENFRNNFQHNLPTRHNKNQLKQLVIYHAVLFFIFEKRQCIIIMHSHSIRNYSVQLCHTSERIFFKFN